MASKLRTRAAECQAQDSLQQGMGAVFSEAVVETEAVVFFVLVKGMGPG